MKEKYERKGLWQGIKNFFYAISVKTYHAKVRLLKSDKKDVNNRNAMKRQRIKDLGFLTTLFLFPTIAILVTYFGQNINTFLLAFKEYDEASKSFHFISGFDNFRKAWDNIAQNVSVGIVLRNSILNYLVGFLIITPLQIFVSFAIYKKVKGTPFFVVVLYLPQIVSSIVWVLIYRYMISYAVPSITGNQRIAYLLSGGDSFGTMIVLWVYYAWVNLGGALMIVTGTFARIEHEVVEACQIDGCNLWKEFWNITFPYYFPVFAIGIFTGVGGIFTASPATYEFFGGSAPEQVWTFGYYFFSLVATNMTTSMVNYPEASAAGIVMTLIVVPIVLITRFIVNKMDKMEGSI